MPNWAEGNIRFRGKRENLIRFFTHELVVTWRRPDGTYGEKQIKTELSKDGYRMDLIFDKSKGEHNLYFRGSNRQFVDTDDLTEDYLEFSKGPNTRDDQVVIMTGYKAAWNVDYSYFQHKAEEYKIDIRTFVWEMGLEWSSVVTWYRDGRKEEETRSYYDWLWDSSMPFYGG